MRRPVLHQQESLDVKMTPMIDVVFLLLVFFVWTSSFELPEFDLPSSLAESSNGTSQAAATATPKTETYDEIVIQITLIGNETQLQMGKEAIAGIDDLTKRLVEIVSLGVQPPVIVDPNDDVPMDQAINVYDAARKAGIDRVLFAAKSE